MKIAFYAEDGLEQLVLTPETQSERALLALLRDETRTIEIKQGSFFETNGGWLRHTRDGDNSTMLVMRRKEPEVIDEDSSIGIRERDIV